MMPSFMRFLEEASLDFFSSEAVHVPLHRLWTFTRFHDNLTSAEQAHVVYCEECRAALGTCLQAESFGSVRKEFRRGEEGRF
jgi:hypothetical protein